MLSRCASVRFSLCRRVIRCRCLRLEMQRPGRKHRERCAIRPISRATKANGVVPRSFVGKGGKFQDSIPVASCPADAKFIFKEGISKARPADAGRVDNVDLPAVEANSLWACYGSLQRLHVLPVWSGLEKHDDEVGGVPCTFPLTNCLVPEESPKRLKMEIPVTARWRRCRQNGTLGRKRPIRNVANQHHLEGICANAEWLG